MSEKEYLDLIKKCLEGERVSQKKLYNALASKLMTVCLRYTKSRPDAEDSLQDSFIKIFNNLSSFKNDGHFEAWARRITVNCLITRFQKAQKQGIRMDLNEIEEIVEVDFNIENRLTELELMRILTYLPEGYKMIFNMHAIEGYSHKEISEIMNINESTSRSNLARAKAILKDVHHKINLISNEGKATN